MFSLSHKRRTGVLSLAAAAAATLYVVMAFVAEPAGVLAVDDEMDVDVTLNGVLSITCASNVSLGSLSAGSSKTGSGTCVVKTNNTAGYTLKWRVPAGSGSANTCGISGVLNCGYGTGSLNSYVKDASTNNGYAAYQIHTFWPADANTLGETGTPEAFTSVSANDIRWAGRLHSTSTTVGGAGMPDFGTEDGTRLFTNVGTGTTAYNIAKRTSQTSVSGDNQNLEFRVIMHSGNLNPATTYKTRIFVTAINN